MKLSLNWIKQFVDLPTDLTGEQISELITLKTAEVEGVENQSEIFKNMVVGKITEIKEHPNADALKICMTDIGDQTVQIVCGGSNIKENMKVLVTLPGSKVRWHGEGDLIELSEAKVRGEKSYGMIAAANEAGLGESEGKEIMDLDHLDAEAGTPIAEALNKNDIIFDIDNKSLTHRPDLWSHYGFAREIAAITNSELKPYPLKNTETPEKGEEIKVTVKNKEIINRWSSLIVEGVKIKESPQWMKSQLESAGVTPVNNIVDITNFVMLELGQPMHAYDNHVVGSKDFTIRYAENSETLETIDHKERKLHEEDPLICSNKPLIVAGVMGGVESEINDETTSIILEAANWDATIIRKASTRHALRSESSQRFEKSLDPEMCPIAIQRAYELVQELCPEAKALGPITDISYSTPATIEIDFDPQKTNKYLGIDLEIKEMQKILESLSFKVKEDKEKLKVTVPSFRATKDVTREVDLIEEIGRIYGYEQIEPRLPNLPTHMPMQNMAREREHEAREILRSFGVNEVRNYSFYSKKDFENIFEKEENHIKLANYLSEEQTHMRVSMLPYMLKNIHKNIKNFEEINIYELGRTYKEVGEFFPAEETKIAFAYKGKNAFLKLKGILEEFFEKFAHQEFELIPNEDAPEQAHPKAAAVIKDEDSILAHLYMVHPIVLENFDLENEEVAYAEVNFAQLSHKTDHVNLFNPLPKFPDMEFDLSILIDKETLSATVEEAIQSSSELVNDVNLFDLYEGSNIPEDKKSLAYRVTLRSLERTLTDKDMADVQEQCFKNLEKIGGQVRGK